MDGHSRRRRRGGRGGEKRGSEVNCKLVLPMLLEVLALPLLSLLFLEVLVLDMVALQVMMLLILLVMELLALEVKAPERLLVLEVLALEMPGFGDGGLEGVGSGDAGARARVLSACVQAGGSKPSIAETLTTPDDLRGQAWQHQESADITFHNTVIF